MPKLFLFFYRPKSNPLHKIFLEKGKDVSLSVSYSGISLDVQNLGTLYRQAKEYLQYRFIFGEDSIITEKRCRMNIDNLESHYPYELDDALIASIREKDVSRLLITLDDIKNALYNMRYTNITICTMELMNIIIRTINEMKKRDSSLDDQALNELYRSTTNAEYLEDFFQELSRYIRLSLGDTNGQNDDHGVKNIRLILDFIQRNYTNPNLSSQMIGDYLGMSNRYIMYKFLESTGKSLNDYIIDVRMRKAANLLKNTSLPISAVASKIGIENNNYFYKLFKKVYNCTPRQFSGKYRDT